MLQPYRSEYFPEVAAFARRLPNFDYVREIIRAHTERHHPGGCWVWCEDGRIAAFCGMLYANARDAWLYGMRVDPRAKSRGIATRFTRRLFRVAAGSGHTWVGLNTLDHRKPAPVFRIAEKLGMKLEAVHATDPFWNLPKRLCLRHASLKPPRLRRAPDIYRHFAEAGQRLFFYEGPGWVWTRLLPVCRRAINRNGFWLGGLPIHVVRHRAVREGKRTRRQTTVNVYDRPEDFRELLRSVLGLAAGKGHGVTINYPAEWRRDLHRAAREMLPALRRGKHYWFTVWRIYGKQLRPPH